MFRFTIRELFLLTIIAALAVALALEHRRGERLENDLSLAENESKNMRTAVGNLHDDIERIEQTLPAHGLKLTWSRDMRPTLESVTLLFHHQMVASAQVAHRRHEPANEHQSPAVRLIEKGIAGGVGDFLEDESLPFVDDFDSQLLRTA
jgi:hypothetical protein